MDVRPALGQLRYLLERHASIRQHLDERVPQLARCPLSRIKGLAALGPAARVLASLRAAPRRP